MISCCRGRCGTVGTWHTEPIHPPSCFSERMNHRSPIKDINPCNASHQRSMVRVVMPRAIAGQNEHNAYSPQALGQSEAILIAVPWPMIIQAMQTDYSAAV